MSEPDGRIPEDAPRINDLNDLFQWTEDRVLQRMRDQLAPTQNHMREALRDGLLGSIADIFKGDSPRLPDLGFLREAWVDGQEAAMDLWRRLSPLEEYASAYMSSAEGLYQGGKISFDRMLVGSKGVTHTNGGFTLNDYGMWRIDCQIWPSNYAVDWGSLDQVQWEVRVYLPDGSLWHRKQRRHIDRDSRPDAVSTTVVVPEVGCRVEVHVTSIAPLRGMRGGADRTHLTVHHINRVVPGPGDNTGRV